MVIKITTIIKSPPPLFLNSKIKQESANFLINNLNYNKQDVIEFIYFNMKRRIKPHNKTITFKRYHYFYKKIYGLKQSYQHEPIPQDLRLLVYHLFQKNFNVIQITKFIGYSGTRYIKYLIAQRFTELCEKSKCGLIKYMVVK